MAKRDYMKIISMLYGSEYKSEFLRQYEGKPSYQTRVTTFQSLTPYEIRLQKDLGAMCHDELIAGLETLYQPNYTTVIVNAQYVRQYLEWYSVHVSPVALQDYQITWKEVDLTEAFRSVLIHSLDEIRRDWAELPPHEGEYYQPLFVLQFYGVYVPQACEILLTEVDGLDREEGPIRIRTNDCDVTIEDKTATEILREYRKFTSRQYPRGARWVKSNHDHLLYSRVREDLVTEDTKLQFQKARDQISRKRYEYGNDLLMEKYQTKNLMMAGSYMRLLQEETRCGQLSDEDFRRVLGLKIADQVQMEAFRMSFDTYKRSCE